MAHIVNHYPDLPSGSEGVDRKNNWRTRNDNNLVIQTKKRRAIDGEPTGEPESLFGKISKEMMGDKAQRTDPKEIVKNMKDYRKDIDDDDNDNASYVPKRIPKIYDTEIVEGYVPTNKTTKELHATLLSHVQRLFSDKPYQFIRSATLDVLDIIKGEGTATEKWTKLKKEVNNNINEDLFTDMLQIAEQLTDYAQEKETKDIDENNMEDQEIPILIEEDEENIGFEPEIAEDEDSAEVKEEVVLMEEDSVEENLGDVDAYWLQRQIHSVVSDEHIAQDLASKVEKILGDDSLDDGDVQQSILGLLGLQNFSLVDLFARNRSEIIGRIAAARAPNDATRDAILATLPSVKKTRRTEQTSETQQKDHDDRKTRMLDLNLLTFGSGSHFMSNQKATFPQNTIRTDLADYTQVDIPMETNIPVSSNLIAINTLPKWAQESLNPLKYLNRIQSAVFPTVFNTNENCLVCAPTGAGKTTVALLSILRAYQNAVENNEKFKAIYIAPMKSLVQEMVGTLQGKLDNLGLKVAEMSGDASLGKKQLDMTDVIVATPEKIDVITRKIGGIGSGCGHGIFEFLKVMIIDEVHLLHDIRGPVLEALVSRINLFSLQNLKTIRLIGLSATLPNCEDVGVFLGVKKNNVFIFGGEFRPVPLQQTFFGITEKKPLKQAQMMNVLTFNKVKEASGKQQVLIFVHSRKDTLQTAKFIKEMALEENCLHTFLQNKKASQEILLSESKKFENEELKELIGVGIGIHHAGMSKDDRRLIEDLYADNHLQVLVSTATLAWGVNLPAHTVIIKGTQVYSPEAGHWEELSPMDVMQMIGRAGRPQFDKEGVGIIITTQREMFFYMSLLSQQLPIESQLITSIVDCLNAEIVIGNIKSIEDGISWLAMTYYYVCMVRSPKLYGVDENDLKTDSTLELRRRDIIHTAASILHKNGLAIYDKRTGRISATELGRVASYYYLTCDTIKAMNDSLHRSATDVDLMRIFSTSSEFKFVSVRETEKPEIQRLLQQVPIPIKEKFDEPTCKINVLLQTYIGRLSLPGFVLSSDTVYVSQNAARIFRSLFELLLIKLWARPAIKALELCKSVARKLFSTQCPLRQIPGASMDICKRLERVDFPFERLFDLTPAQLGELIRLPAKGMALYNTLQAFPRLQLSVISKPVSRSLLHVNITIKAPFNYDHRVHGPSQGYWILVVDTDGEHVLYSQYFLLKQSHYSDPHHISIFVPLLDPLPYNYFVYAISDTYLRCTSTALLPLSNIVLPTRFAPPSELLNLAPLSTKQFLNTFKLPNNFFDFDVFNPLQTQLYQSLVESNSSVFISSHSGSGKTTLAELAILQYLVMNNKKGAALYIVPFDCERTIVYEEMKKKFNTVVLMENSFEQAKKQMETSQIVICSVHDFEMFTKDWRNDSTLTTLFGLIILDDIQRISEDVEYEIVISRIRIIQKAGNPIRLIGLSLPIADSKSMREWLGVSQTNCYSFKPTSRISPINIRLEVMRQTDYAMRIQAMVQPIIELAFESVNKGKSVAVVVPGRKVMVQVVQEYITLLKRKELISFDENQMICVDQQKEKLLEDNKEVLKDPLLLQALQVGIGILYYAESNQEKYIIKEMFGKKHLSIVFMTFDELEDFRVHCDDGIVMGTTKSERSGIELEMEMLNKFSGCIRNGTLAIYCEPNKKDFISKCLEESQPLESRLVQQEDGKIGLLTHVINNEIVNGVIVDYQSAINYLTNTYFYKRLRCNPSYYGLGARDMTAVSGFLSAFVEEVFNTLKEFQFITINEDEQTITPTETGRIALTTQMDETD